MRSKTFSQLSTLIVVLVSIYVLVLIGERLAPAVPSPLLNENPPSSDASTSTAAVPTEASPAASTEALQTIDVRAPGGTIHAMISSTSDEQILGLGDRLSLPTGAGMLFPFAEPGLYGFWMVNMRFSLDIVWIGADKRVTGIVRGVSPDTYPEVFSPPSPISYVLELNQGDAAKFDIATGTQLVF